MVCSSVRINNFVRRVPTRRRRVKRRKLAKILSVRWRKCPEVPDANCSIFLFRFLLVRFLLPSSFSSSWAFARTRQRRSRCRRLSSRRPKHFCYVRRVDAFETYRHSSSSSSSRAISKNKRAVRVASLFSSLLSDTSPRRRRHRASSRRTEDDDDDDDDDSCVSFAQNRLWFFFLCVELSLSLFE